MVRTYLPSCCTDLSPRKLIVDHQLRSRMEKIGGRLDSILEQKKDLELSESNASAIRKISNSHFRMTTSLPEANVLGRKEDERAILAKLLTEETHEDLSVIPIVGIGGLGKTTLAKSVSDNFNKIAIARSLLGSLTRRSGGNEDDLNVLHNKLREILSNQKFLIVLDDYWNKNYSDWDEIYNLFNLGAKGSKVIVTTRDEGVASMMTNLPTFHLGKLSNDDCLSLLAYHAFGVSNFDAHTHLKSIGEAIALKCKGLPLAAKALGGLLRSKPKIASEWADIRDSKIWTLEPGKDDIFVALKLSYIHLPSHLKRCFIFCAIFPEDHEFDRDELVLLWMAEGLVEMKPRNSRSSILDQGRKQFDELLGRSFFQRSTQKESLFVMHDLILDLAKSIGGNTCLKVKAKIEDVKCKSPEKVRHLLYSSISSDILDAEFEKCHVLKRLRTFIASHEVITKGHLSDEAREKLLQNLEYLRAFYLSGYKIDKLPNCIGNLKHLRYLNFYRCYGLQKLPESVCTLYNLETLLLNCCGITELPPGMDKLINLKCLDISGTPELKKMPVEVGRLHNLEILTKFIVGREEDGLRLKVLRKLQHLQGHISIFGLQNVEDVGDAGLSGKVGLTYLALIWYDWKKDFGRSFLRNADKENKVFEFLHPHREIKVVVIIGYGGVKVPSWIGDPSMAHMTIVHLSFCAAITTLPSFGLLPCLRELRIRKLDAMSKDLSHPWKFSTSRTCQLGKFGLFHMCDKVIEEPFPRLVELGLYFCPRLVSSLPHRLCSLVNLCIFKCPLLKASSCMADLSSLNVFNLR